MVLYAFTATTAKGELELPSFVYSSTLASFLMLTKP